MPEPDRVLPRVLVVMSRNPGSLRDRKAMQALLRPIFTENGLVPIFADLEAQGMSERIRNAAEDGFSAVIAAGGDGTVSFVGQQLVHAPTPLGVIPLGTMNVFAKDIGLPLGDTGAAVAVIAAGHVRTVDVGAVNGRVFLCGSMLGLPARLAQYRKRGDTWWQSMRIWARYARALLRALLHFRPLRATLSLGGRTERLRVSSLMITPNPVNGADGPLLGRSELTGNRLAVYVIDRLRVHDLLRLALRALLHRWQDDAVVRDHEVDRLAVISRSAGLRVMNDGEVVVMASPLRYRVLPRALRVLSPAPVQA